MKQRILLVEDEDPVAKYLELYLEEEGYRVDRAMSLMMASASTANRQYDLILLDLILPDGSADDWLIRSRESGLNTPTLMITGVDPSDERLTRCLDSGAAGWIPKTGRVEGLLAKIRSAIGR